MALYGEGTNVHTSNQPERYSKIRKIGEDPHQGVLGSISVKPVTTKM